MSETPNLVIYYHSPCPDGNASAWAIKYNLEQISRTKNDDKFANGVKYNIIYKPSAPGCSNLDLELMRPLGSQVWFVDLMPSVNKFQELINHIQKMPASNNKNQLYKIVVLDHHKSNMEICTQITSNTLKYNKSAFYEMKQTGRNISSKGSNNSVSLVFDMTRSGCQIAWDWITAEIYGSPLARPWFIDYIADMDLWTWRLPFSRQINSAFTGMALTQSLDSINQLNEYTTPEQISKYIESELIPFAKVSEKINAGMISNSISKASHCLFVLPSGRKYRVWLGNITSELRSELGNQLCKTLLPDGSMPDLAAIWNYDFRANEWLISLRSIGKQIDCSSIAREFTGGGGHLNAAGFSIKNVCHGTELVGSLYSYFVPLLFES